MNYQLLVVRQFGTAPIWQTLETTPFVGFAVGQLFQLGANSMPIREVHHAFIQGPGGTHVQQVSIVV